MLSQRNVVVLISAVALAMAAFYILLPVFVQLFMRMMLRIHYSFNIEGKENVPMSGPALFASNHTSWIDGFILASMTPRRGKAMVNAGLLAHPLVKALAVRAGIIPTPYAGPRAIRVALEGARDALAHGHAIAIFPEGQISRTGLLQPFLRGIEVILKGHEETPVIPVAIDNLWGSLFSRSGGRFFKKRPESWRRTVNIVFGPPVKAPVTAFRVRQAVLETMARAYELRKPPIRPFDMLDLTLPKWEHPTLGLLTASTQNLIYSDINQIGNKEGSVGHPCPGVAIRIVNGDGTPLPPKTVGRIEALVAFKSNWTDTGKLGSQDADGFVRLAESP